MLAFEKFVQDRLFLIRQAPDIDSFTLNSSATTIFNRYEHGLLTRNCFFVGPKDLTVLPAMCGLVSKKSFLQAQVDASTETEAWLRRSQSSPPIQTHFTMIQVF